MKYLYNLLFIFILLTAFSAHAQKTFYLKHGKDKIRWQTWSESVLMKAKERNKPIWVYVGFFGCQWCSVMAKESFSDPKLADIAENLVIPVFIDKFHLPELDSKFQDWALHFNGSSGWPLNLLLTPDGQPFASANFLNSQELHTYLKAGSALWRHNPEEALIRSRLKKKPISSLALSDKSPLFIHHFEFEKKIKLIEGGDSKVINEVKDKFQFLIKSRLWDVVNHGFHRYASDELGNEPHFEKMLNDNARMLSNFMNFYLYDRNPIWQKIAYKIKDLILKEFRVQNELFGNTIEAVPQAYVLKEGCNKIKGLTELPVKGGVGIIVSDITWFQSPAIPDCWTKHRKSFVIRRDHSQFIYTNALVLSSLMELAIISGDEHLLDEVRVFAEKFLIHFYSDGKWRREIRDSSSDLLPEDKGALLFFLSKLTSVYGEVRFFNIYKSLLKDFNLKKFSLPTAYDPSWLSPQYFQGEILNLEKSLLYVRLKSENERASTWKSLLKEKPQSKRNFIFVTPTQLSKFGITKKDKLL